MYLPSPVELVIGTDIAMARIINNQEMVRTCIIQEGCNPDSKLDAGIGHSGYRPLVGVVVVLLFEHLLKSIDVFHNRVVLLPPKHQNRHAGVVRLEGLLIYMHGGIL